MHRCLLQHRKKYGIASTIFKETSRTYKRLCRKKKYLFELNKSNELMSLRSKNPKMYWNLLKQGYNSPKLGDIQMSDWLEHFAKLSFSNHVQNDSIKYWCKVHSLDKPFSIQELREAIFYCISYHKAIRLDGVSNEILKWGLDWLQSILLDLFNLLLKEEQYPESWNKLIMIPIFKNSGSLHDPNNYRGITIISCLAKLFCVMVNTRIYNWAEQHQLISCWQGGFRKNRGCISQCFKLMTAIKYQLSAGKYKKGLKGRIFACLFC